MADGPRVAVIVAAFNAEATVGAAVRSALREAEVAEVIVVDDGSVDATKAAALACEDGSGRLRVLRQRNAGPAAARNAGVRASNAPLWCVLDADDVFLPGRFARLFAAVGVDWDMAADGVEIRLANGRTQRIPGGEGAPREIGLHEFVLGNVPRRKTPRMELGYLQPVKRRAFFAAHGLSFDTSLKFAEDYALYAKALALGARFVCVGDPGYLAQERAGSLSHTPTAADFERLIGFDRELLAGSCASAQRALRRHIKLMQLKARFTKVETALADGSHASALRHALSDHHTAGFVFNHLYRQNLSRTAKRLLGLDPDRDWCA
jgi:succinoglycan biosynthesis protein ExoU